MSSYLSNLLTHTTSRYNTLRRTLLKDEDDGDTEDDSHISRVLRAYYTEKGRPFPPWLPPDPNDRKAITPQPGYMQQQSSYFNRGGQVAAVQQQSNSRPSSLSDLWDSPAQNNAPMQPQSLRNARRPLAQQAAPTSSGASTLAPRPLPSQRAGSYQSAQSAQSQASGRSDFGGSSTPPPGSGGGTAQDRLKARLWGGARSGSPGNAGGSGNGPFEQPAYGSGNPYESGRSGGSGGGAGNRRYGRLG